MSSRPEVPEPCQRARADFAAYRAAGSAGIAEVRDHLRGCPECRAAFARAVGCGDAEATGVRSERLRRERHARRGEQRGLALAGAFQGWTGGVRGARLRLLLVPALAIVLMTQVSRGPRMPGEVRAQALGGAVWLGDEDLPSGAEPRSVWPGEGCSTGGDGRARLDSGAASVELSPEAWAWLEAHAPARFRLGPGRFVLRGDLTATTRWGVLECEAAHVEVRVTAGGLVAEVLDGTLRCIDHRGERALTRGQRTQLP